jgi:hypothetical protein
MIGVFNLRNAKTNIMKLNPCIEKLSDMSIKDNGRHCSSCNTTVVDLTEKSNEQINQLYIENNGKLCGIVKPNQLAENKHYHPLKKFALALLLVFGSTLFVISCDARFDFKEFQSEAYIQLHNTESSSVIKGFVYYDGAAITTAEILFKNGDIIYTAKTDSKGAFELHLPDLTVKSVDIEIKAYGFAEVKRTINLNGTEIFAGKINLEKQIIECTKGEISPVKMGKIAAPETHQKEHKTLKKVEFMEVGIIEEPRFDKGDVAPQKKDSEFD